MSTTFIAIYSGDTINSAKVVAVSADPQLVSYVAEKLLESNPAREPACDPVVNAIEDGRRQALKIIKGGEHG